MLYFTIKPYLERRPFLRIIDFVQTKKGRKRHCIMARTSNLFQIVNWYSLCSLLRQVQTKDRDQISPEKNLENFSARRIEL